MKLQIVSKPTALSLKELGFDLECQNFYAKTGSKMFGIDEQGRHYLIQKASSKLYTVGEHITISFKNVLPAPTQALVCKWLRDIHNINIEFTDGGINQFCPSVKHVDDYVNNKGYWQDGCTYGTYEQAEEAGIIKALEILKENKDG